MMWTLLLVATGLGGMYFVETKPRFGWPMYLVNEVLWFAYALAIGALPLAVMAVVWFALGARNLRKAWFR